MDTKIISGFPGVGKSECTKSHAEYLDSDSSQYSWKRAGGGEIEKDADGKNIRHPDFPNNYIEHIKSKIGHVPVIFVSSHKDVRDALVANEIPFTLVYPQHELKGEYLQRYEMRGSPKPFLDLIEKNWDNFLGELEAQKGCDKIVLSQGQFLSGRIDQARTTSGNRWTQINPKRDPAEPDDTGWGKDKQ